MASNVRAMNPVPIATKPSVQHYPAFSLPSHTNESLCAAYAAQAQAAPRSASVIGTSTTSERGYYNHTDYVYAAAAATAATHAATNDHPYKFLVQPHSVRTLKTLCTTSANLPTLIKASLEANLRGMGATGKIIFHLYSFVSSSI